MAIFMTGMTGMTGIGKTVIFIHGWSMTSEFWINQEIIPGYNLVKHNLLDSDNNFENDFTIAQFAISLHNQIKELNSEIHLVGWSMGASIIFQYIMDYGSQGIKSITLVSGNPKIVSDEKYDLGTQLKEFRGLLSALDKDHSGTMEFFIKKMFNNLSQSQLQYYKSEVLKTPRNTAIKSLHDLGNKDYRELLPKINLPTLIIHGTSDQFNNIKVAEYMLTKILDSRLVSFENSSHCPQIEEPEKFNKTLANFLEEL